MSLLRLTFLRCVAAVITLPALAFAEESIAIVGDSTVCDYAPERPDRGWGQFIAEHFRPGTVAVTNLAKAGRSTRTFIKEGLWEKALAAKPAYVLIQFGHNDSHAPDKPESTDAATTYKDFLRRYIDDSRAISATPILITPVARRTFAADGTLEDTLQPYADAMKEVAKEKTVSVIDLHASSKQLVTQLGPEKSAAMANKKGDTTHFNEQGARTMADLLIKDLPTAAPSLKELLITP
ncbi:rhamnogalacturonan acetylesterase [Luteolibacter soli]|uniref:Rhamnogalacturonan acetylesterase n=1 Tax=Luteolibacter soli TaxID=3135280 RepID=A0ABU9AUQ1_9BACT